jgi:hypothetical protein
MKVEDWKEKVQDEADLSRAAAELERLEVEELG